MAFLVQLPAAAPSVLPQGQPVHVGTWLHAREHVRALPTHPVGGVQSFLEILGANPCPQGPPRKAVASAFARSSAYNTGPAVWAGRQRYVHLCVGVGGCVGRYKHDGVAAQRWDCGWLISTVSFGMASPHTFQASQLNSLAHLLNQRRSGGARCVCPRAVFAWRCAVLC